MPDPLFRMADIQTFADGSAWADACAARLTQALSVAVAADGAAFFAGSGGSTPAPVYRQMAKTPLDWARVTVTLVDERSVPEASPDSNAALLKQTLLTGPAARARFIPLFSPQITVDRAALVAAQALARVGRPLDAVLLGMGEDGHIASIFPGSPALKPLLAADAPPRVMAVARGRGGAAPPQDRLSLNLPWLASAGCIVLALTGSSKRAVFEREAAGDAPTSPIARLIAARRDAAVAPLEVLWTETA